MCEKSLSEWWPVCEHDWKLPLFVSTRLYWEELRDRYNSLSTTPVCVGSLLLLLLWLLWLLSYFSLLGFVQMCVMFSFVFLFGLLFVVVVVCSWSFSCVGVCTGGGMFV